MISRSVIKIVRIFVDPCLDQAPFLIKLDSDQSTWSSNRLTNNGNRPYHEVQLLINAFFNIKHNNLFIVYRNLVFYCSTSFKLRAFSCLYLLVLGPVDKAL